MSSAAIHYHVLRYLTICCLRFLVSINESCTGTSQTSALCFVRAAWSSSFFSRTETAVYSVRERVGLKNQLTSRLLCFIIYF
jgi:hypothetical protein